MALKRLDILLCDLGLCTSREQAQRLILAGAVWTGQQRLEKPGVKIKEETPIEIRNRTPDFASRGGEKLIHALTQFEISVEGRVCLDLGASTGGFTDCLLKRGAKHVFAVDVGYGQLEARLRADVRVTNMERTNARFLAANDLAVKNPLACSVDLLVMDVSFISLRKIIEPIAPEFPKIKDWVLLFKPQFEVGREFVGKGGLVRDSEAVKAELADFDLFMNRLGLAKVAGPETSPITGKKSGNLEYLVHYRFQKGLA